MLAPGEAIAMLTSNCRAVFQTSGQKKMAANIVALQAENYGTALALTGNSTIFANYTSYYV